MIASRPDRRVARMTPGVAAAALWLAASFAAYGQDSGDKEKDQQAEKAEAAQESARQSEGAKAESEDAKAVRRLYLGAGLPKEDKAAPDPAQQKSTKPVSIMPRPFVRPGSLKPPAIQPLEPVPATESAAIPDAEAVENSSPITEGFVGEELLEGELAALDPSLLAVSGIAASFQAPGFWQGYDHSRAAQFFESLAHTELTGPLRNLVRDISVQPITLSAAGKTAADQDVEALLRARLALFGALGDQRGYIGLISSLPIDKDWAALDNERLHGALAAGDLSKACALAETARERSSDAFWLRVSVMCAAARGDRAALDFRLGILEELAPVPEDFYSLSDLLLVEAESSTEGTATGTVPTLTSAVALDALTIHMASLAKARIENVDPHRATPLGIVKALSLPGMSDEARDMTLRAAAKRGLLRGDQLISLALATTVAEDSHVDLFVNAGLTEDFNTDIALLALAGSSGATEAERRQAAIAVWQRAVRLNRTGSIAGALTNMTSDLPTDGSLSDAVRLRASLIAGDTALAGRLFAALRTMGDADQPAVADALVRAAPLVAISGLPEAAAFTTENFQAWWRTEQAVASNGARAVLLLSTAEGLGLDVNNAMWDALLDADTSGVEAAPVPLWRAFIIAREMSDKPALVRRASQLLSETNAQRVSPAMVGSVLEGLCHVDLCDTARRIATDLLVRAGL